MTLESFSFKKRSSTVTTVPTECQTTKGIEDAIGVDVGPVTKSSATTQDDRPWLQYVVTVLCMVPRLRQKSRQKFICKGCASMRIESIKEHGISRQHKNCESANLAHKRPDQAPLERVVRSIEIETLLRSAYYLVQAERPFRDSPNLMQLQEVNGLSFGQTYRSSVGLLSAIFLRKFDQIKNNYCKERIF